VAEELPFVELVRRVCRGDEAASAELVRRYEPAIRIAVRGRLNDPGLRRLFDSMDACQSILANFFVRATAGEFELDRPDQLIQLLATMAGNRVTDHALAVSPDGSTLAAVSSGTIHLWNLRRLRAELAAMRLDWSRDQRLSSKPK
jgi:hypothetical protein